MEDFRKKTEEELLDIKRKKLVPNIITREVDIEIQRRQQEENNKQISSLIAEIIKLKDITDENTTTSAKNARIANMLATTAIFIAVFSLIIQILFSTHQQVHCRMSNTSTDDPFIHYTECYRNFDLGLFGERSYRIPDFVMPKETK